MHYGIALAPAADAWKTVQRAEALGFSHAWLYDTQLLCADVFVAMACAAANTRRITIGPGVLVPTNRIAPVTANGLASLNKLAPGRIALGIGTGFTARLTMGQGPMKLSALREYLRVVRGMLRGETVEWTDETATPRKIRFLNPEAGLIDIASPVPVHLSAFAPKARAMAARECEGWMNFVTVLPVALHELEEMKTACRAAGRAPESLYKTGFTLGCVLRPGEDPNGPRARAQAGPLAVVLFHGIMEGRISADLLPPQLQAAAAEYRKVYETYEPPDARYLHLHTGHLMWVRPEEERFLSAELIRMSTFTAERDELVDRVRMLRDAGYQQLAVQLVPGHEDAMEDWMEVFSHV
jgi:alkanesulfonate monooxygenase SsuD/methylene tetrahydromethanopterin reductase-like flavin-dependent oxidoreductase (luciferase family)